MSGAPTKRAARSPFEVSVTFDALVIKAGGVLHLHLQRSKLIGVHSWIMGERKQFFIEYTLTGGAIVCDYDSREKWQSILDQLERLL